MIYRRAKKYWIGIPPWAILGALIILVPIFAFMTFENIEREKEFTTKLLVENGTALIRSFEAGTRTGMMGMMGMRSGGFNLQRLLMETAQQPDIIYLIVTDQGGTILAHNDPARIGKTHGKVLDLKRIAHSERVEWRHVSNRGRADTFEVYRRFSPTQRRFSEYAGRMMHEMGDRNHINRVKTASNTGRIIFVGFDMGPIEAARKEDTRHTIIMAAILLLIGFTGIFSLFIVQAYRSTKISLARIQAFSDNVVENMPIGLLATDADGRIASFNQAAESVFQISSSDVLGKRADEVLPRQLVSLAGEIETEKGIIEKEIEIPSSHGKRIPLEVSMSRLEKDQHTFMGHVILLRDLTEVQNLKKEVERSRHLASLGRLAAGVAHEIRNPLSSIKGFATYFRERFGENTEDQKTADIMIQEVDRLNRVITQLLEFARPMAIQKKSTTIRPVIQHALKIIEREAQAKKIKINTNFSPAINKVPIDPDRISQVLLNLFLNAIEAMEKGGVLSVVLSYDGGPRRIAIAVSDTGVGINKKDLVHIFDPYFTTKQAGTGLGLAVVHRIIESHKGEIRVESKIGGGTTITISLPASDDL